MTRDTRLAHDRYARLLAEESDRFLAAARGADPGAGVPSCPDWDVDDLLWHLSEVQDFWGLLASGRAATSEEAEALKVERAALHDDLVSRFESASASLRLAVGRAPETACWTWFDDDQTVGWVARRQAHEALVHRVDAELAAEWPVGEADPELAADGIDELLRVFVDGLPPWGEFRAVGGPVRLETTDTGDTWDAQPGGLWGTSPRSGRTYEGLDTAQVLDAPAAEPAAVVRGTAWALDRWLWGRGDLAALDVTGDDAAVARLRAACVVE